MKIQSLELKNFRCFEDITIDFHKRLTVLVGTNGSGKTSFLEAIGCFFSDNSFISDGPNSKCTIRDIRKGCSDIALNGIFSKNERQYSMKVHYSYEIQGNDSCFWNTIDDEIYKNLLDREYGNFIFSYYNATRGSLVGFDATVRWFDKIETNEAREAKRTRNLDFVIPELAAVRRALSDALGEYDRPFAMQDPNATTAPVLYVYKKGSDITYEVSQLSDGYRALLALVADLARCMAAKNAHFYMEKGNIKAEESVLQSPAIVLIDEIELHLHPSWQQRVLPDLMRIFPNTQFIVTTHSPQVLTSIPSECIRILEDGKVYDAPAGSQGADASRLLKRILGVDARPPLDPVTQNLKTYKELVYADKWESEEAKKLRQELDHAFKGQDPIFTELDLHIANRKWELEQ